ncbi:MAG: hypothetical protein N2578_06355, partial [Bdellovibrionaceae bacterium]|nr:hypothetical protein [Pseudobdellovibrionaceae bacterium]
MDFRKVDRKIIILCLSVFLFSAMVRADLQKISEAKKHGPGLSIKNNIPVWNKKNTKDIPKLDIGAEAKLKADVKPLPVLPAAGVTFKTPPPVPVMKIPPSTLKAVEKANSPVRIVTPESIARVPAITQELGVRDPAVEEPKIRELTIRPFEESERQLFEALIWLEEHKNPRVALGLLTELLEDKKIGLEAKFHYASAAAELGIFSEFRNLMLEVAKNKKDKDLRKAAHQKLLEQARALQVSDVPLVLPGAEEFALNYDKKDDWNYLRAKYHLESGDLNAVEGSLALIARNSGRYKDALHLAAVYNYRRGQPEEALKNLKELMGILPPRDPQRNHAALLMGRILFQLSDYKGASEAYRSVERTHSQWLEAMVELAWSQTLMGDHEGAAGNMFTLHTDYFRNAFSPESYVVRSVSYLNLCQFADGKQVTNNLLKKYGPIMARIQHFSAQRQSPDTYYDLVRTFLRNPDLREVEGLPKSVIIELARNPEFIRLQGDINTIEDEMELFTKANIDLIEYERNLIRQQAEGREEVARYKSLIAKGNRGPDTAHLLR